MTRLLLIRYGEIDYNLEKRYCSFSNPPLNVSGISQVKNLARQLKDLEVAVVYPASSPKTPQLAAGSNG